MTQTAPDQKGPGWFRILVGIVLGLAIGAACRRFALPAPNPPELMGAFLILSITSGYAITDWWIEKRATRMLSDKNGSAA